MRGLPQELVYFLIFLGVLVVQFLMKRRAASRQPPQPDEDEAPSEAELAAEAAWLEHQAAQAGWPPPPAAVPLAPPQRAPAPPPMRRMRPRRFSRQALMGNRQDVQNAVVIAAILGPCRALEPPGDDAAPGAPPPPGSGVSAR